MGGEPRSARLGWSSDWTSKWTLHDQAEPSRRCPMQGRLQSVSCPRGHELEMRGTQDKSGSTPQRREACLGFARWSACPPVIPSCWRRCRRLGTSRSHPGTVCRPS
jgi:hypothetical protein